MCFIFIIILGQSTSQCHVPHPGGFFYSASPVQDSSTDAAPDMIPSDVNTKSEIIMDSSLVGFQRRTEEKTIDERAVVADKFVEDHKIASKVDLKASIKSSSLQQDDLFADPSSRRTNVFAKRLKGSAAGEEFYQSRNLKQNNENVRGYIRAFGKILKCNTDALMEVILMKKSIQKQCCRVCCFCYHH